MWVNVCKHLSAGARQTQAVQGLWHPLATQLGLSLEGRVAAGTDEGDVATLVPVLQVERLPVVEQASLLGVVSHHQLNL